MANYMREVEERRRQQEEYEKDSNKDLIFKKSVKIESSPFFNTDLLKAIDEKKTECEELTKAILRLDWRKN